MGYSLWGHKEWDMAERLSTAQHYIYLHDDSLKGCVLHRIVSSIRVRTNMDLVCFHLTSFSSVSCSQK